MHVDKGAIASRIRRVRRDLYGDDGLPAMADALGLPARTWENYKDGVTIPGESLLAFLALTSARPEWAADGPGAAAVAALMLRFRIKVDPEKATRPNLGGFLSAYCRRLRRAEIFMEKAQANRTSCADCLFSYVPHQASRLTMGRAVLQSSVATFHLPIAIPSQFDLGQGIPCSSCTLALDLHQPDADAPEFLLGTCPACGAWHLIDASSDQAGAVIVGLPGGDAIRAAIEEAARTRSPDRSRRTG